MDLGLKGKVAAVSAASKGIGKAIAFELAKEGARLSICARNKETLEQTARSIEKDTGAEVFRKSADVSQLADIEEFAKATLDHYGHVDVLVNNAGGPPPGLFVDFTDEDWKRAIDLNLLSAIRMISKFLPSMIQQKRGRIVNSLSISVKEPIDNLILSNATRVGVVALAKTLSRQLAPYNILINNVCPGLTLTDRVRELAESRSKKENRSAEDVIKEIQKEVPVGRLGKPEEIAALVVFLASERASFITGVTIQVDGGQISALM